MAPPLRDSFGRARDDPDIPSVTTWADRRGTRQRPALENRMNEYSYCSGCIALRWQVTGAHVEALRKGGAVVIPIAARQA